MKDKRILILFLTIFIDLLGFGIVIPILPNLAKTLAGTSGMPFNPDVAVGVVAGSFSIIQFLFAPIFGAWSDRIGRRPIILMSVFANIIGYYLFGISANFSFLLFSRVISGFGSANISAAQAYIADITAPADRAKRMGIIGAAFGLGFVFGPPIGGWLYHHGGIDGVQWVGFFRSAMRIEFYFGVVPFAREFANQISREAQSIHHLQRIGHCLARRYYRGVVSD